MERPRDPRLEGIQDQLTKLASVLSDISAEMRKIADQRRGGLPEFAQTNRKAVFEELRPFFSDEGLARAKEMSKKPTSVDPDCGVPQLRYAQYVEFTNAAEFMKFRDLPGIDRTEIEAVDWSDLERKIADLDSPEAA